MSFLASKGYFWPLTASMTLEVKNNYAYVITQDICNKFIEVNFCVGCMVSEPNRLLQRSTTMFLINNNKKTRACLNFYIFLALEGSKWVHIL